jgi:prephenate dehydratase
VPSKIGYLGPSGSHSQTAARVFAERSLGLRSAGSGITLVPMMTLTHILDAVEEEAVTLGIIPVENALEGSVAEVLDSLSLRLTKTTIRAEFVRPVQHALIRKYEFVDGIAYIHSHPQAIGQCREAVHALLGPDVKFVPASSTSEAVKSLMQLDESHAALGTVQAAKHYGLEVLIENIGNMSQNATRFLVVAAGEVPGMTDPETSGLPWKTSLCLGLHENKPGALLEIITVLARFGANMSKIESRPTKKSLGEYLFYLDIEGAVTPEAEAAIREQTSLYKCLGVYPMYGVLNGEAVEQITEI